MIEACNIGYRDWKLHIGLMGEGRYLQWKWDDRCADTGEVCRQSGRKWYVSKHATKSEIVQTAFAAALACEEHECRERFTYNGVKVFHPHHDIDALAGVADEVEVRT